ncbi:hypothetical protein ACHWQZ_G001339 [Mnemiopsis leidyi]
MEIHPYRATQETTANTNLTAAHAVDRDLSTCAATNVVDGEVWLKIEFGKTAFIHKIVIYGMFYSNYFDQSDWCAKNVDNFRVCINDANDVDVSVYQGEVLQKSCGTLQLTYGLEQSDQIYTLICNVYGETVKLSKTKGNITVMEVVTLGKDRNLDIAELAPTRITHSKTSEDDERLFAAEHAGDRRLTSRSDTEPVDGEAWLKLEFQPGSFIHKVVFYGRFMTHWYNTNSSCLLSEDHFRNCVDFDQDGALVEVSVYQGEVLQKSCGTLQMTYGLEQSDQIYTLLCNINGDSVKLSKVSGNIRVYDLAVTSKYRKEKIAEITPTSVTQGRPFRDKEEFKAANAVDRDLSTRAETGLDSGEIWFKLELGKTFFIHRVHIYNIFCSFWYLPDAYCAKSRDNFKTCIDQDIETDVSVYQGEVLQKSCGTVKLTYGLEQSDQIYTLFCNTEGDTVTFTSDGIVMRIAEVTVVGSGKKMLGLTNL